MKPSEMLVDALDVQDQDILAFVDENFRIKKERKTAEVSFVFVQGFELAKDAKIPNQAKFLLDAIQASESPLTYTEWGAAATELGMGTKQDPARIAAYYRPLLEKAGAVAKA